MTKEEKRLLRNLHRLDPETFNKLKYDRKFVCFIAVFNEYLKEVAIPKKWDFTKTIKHWPDGTGEGEGITEDGRVWYTDEKNTLLQEVLNYPDLGLFAMENYGLVIDSYAVPNKEDMTSPPLAALHLYKVSKAEALSFTNKIREDFHKYEKNKPVSDRWDEKESGEDLAFDMIERFHELSREEKIHLSAYITHRFAEEMGIPIAEHHRDIDTDMRKVLQENQWTIKQVWKHKKEFFWFSIGNYGLFPIFAKNMRMSIMKIPDKTLDKMLDVMKSGRDFTVEEMDAIWNETEAEANKDNNDRPVGQK